MSRPFMFYVRGDSTKGFDFSPWGGIDGFLQASKQGAAGNGVALKRLVPDLARAVDMTAVAVSSLPFDVLDEKDNVYDTSSNWQNKLVGLPNPQKLIYLLASSLCGGAAYLIPRRTPKYIYDLQYCAPSSITPYIDAKGLQWFDRATDKGKAERVYPDKMIYFWLPDSDVEIGPAENHPLGNAATDAQTVYNLKDTVREFGERNFIPITLLGVKGNIPPDEREKTETFFDKLLRFGFKEKAKVVNTDALSIEQISAGMEEMKQSFKELRDDAKESIADAFGIPAALFMSDKAYASEMDILTRQWYVASRFVSIYQTIAETLTDQLLKAYGYKLRFNLEALDIFQEDESNRASSLGQFVSAVDTNPKIAKLGMNVLGYELDKDQEATLDELIQEKEEAKEKVEKQMEPNDKNPEGEPAAMPVEQATEELDKGKVPAKAHETSAMIALRIPDIIKMEIQSKYPFADPELVKDLHITLVYLGDNRTLDKLDVVRAVSDLGMFQAPIKGKLQGLARFVSGGEKDPIVMTFDSPQAPKLYNMLCGLLDNYHVPYHKEYGFIPHMTLAYIGKDEELPIETIEPIEINFSEVYYVDGEVWYPVDLVGYENKNASLPVVSLSADEIKDLALWYDRAKQWHLKGKTAVDWECRHLRESIAAPVRLKLAEAKTEEDIAMAFSLGETITPMPVYKSETIILDTQAEAINRLSSVIEKAIKEVGNDTK